MAPVQRNVIAVRTVVGVSVTVAVVATAARAVEATVTKKDPKLVKEK